MKRSPYPVLHCPVLESLVSIDRQEIRENLDLRSHTPRRDAQAVEERTFENRSPLRVHPEQLFLALRPASFPTNLEEIPNNVPKQDTYIAAQVEIDRQYGAEQSERSLLCRQCLKFLQTHPETARHLHGLSSICFDRSSFAPNT